MTIGVNSVNTAIGKYYPMKPYNSPEWVRKGYDLLNEVDRYLNHLLVDHWFGAMREEGMPPEVLDAKHAFVAEEIDEVGLRRRLKLMKPVLESRLRQK